MGIKAHHLERLRTDSRFEKRLGAQFQQLYQEYPGERHIVAIPKYYTRFELRYLLKKAGAIIFDGEDSPSPYIENLEPQPKAPWSLESQDELKHPIELEFFTPEIGYRVNYEEARFELDQRDLVPANTEEAFVFALLAKDEVPKQITDDPHAMHLSLIPLDSEYSAEWTGPICIDRNRKGQIVIGHWQYSGFAAGTTFLAKRKPKPMEKK